MGGPTANLYGADCPRWDARGACDDKRCLAPQTCRQLDPGYDKSLQLYRRIRSLPGVKHAFIGSGFRHDLFGDPRTDAYLSELCRYHVSGRLKVAPEHVSEAVLEAMGKPPLVVYEHFVEQFKRVGRQQPSKRFLVNYFISGHPGASLHDALEMARYLIARRRHPEQIQDFIPLPLTLSGAMYYTEKDPFTEKPLHVAKTFRERKMQRALIQYRQPANRQLIRDALSELNASHLESLFFGGSPARSGSSRSGGKGRRSRPHRNAGRATRQRPLGKRTRPSSKKGRP
jgi:uncharacterized radical SAM protein YgiQ